jgi:hypothetical protein
MYPERRAAVTSDTLRRHPQSGQGTEEVPHRPLTHPRDTINDIFSLTQGNEGSDKPGGRTAVADKQFCAMRRYDPARAFHGDTFRRGVRIYRKTQCTEAVHHALCIVSEEGAGERRRSLSKGSEGKRAIGDALRAWYTRGPDNRM